MCDECSSWEYIRQCVINVRICMNVYLKSMLLITCWLFENPVCPIGIGHVYLFKYNLHNYIHWFCWCWMVFRYAWTLHDSMKHKYLLVINSIYFEINVRMHTGSYLNILQTYLQETMKLVSQHASNQEVLRVLFSSIVFVCKIFNSLNAQVHIMHEFISECGLAYTTWVITQQYWGKSMINELLFAFKHRPCWKCRPVLCVYFRDSWTSIARKRLTFNPKFIIFLSKLKITYWYLYSGKYLDFIEHFRYLV